MQSKSPEEANIKDAVIILKVDQLTKDEAQKVAEELGFSLSSLINAFLKQLIRTKSVSFTITPNKD